jgi:hypothetical protein
MQLWRSHAADTSIRHGLDGGALHGLQSGELQRGYRYGRERGWLKRSRERKRPAPDGVDADRSPHWLALRGDPFIPSPRCGKNFNEACARAERCGRRDTTRAPVRFVTTNAARPVLSWCSGGVPGGGIGAGSPVSPQTDVN